MVNVSSGFKELACAPGREISCEIEIGDNVFRDSEILSFEFNDVVHSEDMQFGTCCSNRFHFELITETYIPLSSVIKPFVRFEGSDERCPLGVFFISRRYRRKNRYSITCYDMMYRLDDKFESELTFPCTAQELLADICANKEIEAVALINEEISCRNTPAQATFREVLGYLAGLMGCCAKFDREGRLCFRALEKSDFRITRDNYFSLSLTQDPCEIRQITMNTAEGELTAGKGTKKTTYVCDNPFATQEIVDSLFEKWKDFSYHGMELDMQGLPFIEAGDVVEVQNDNDNGVFIGIVSELELCYDGALSATLYSRAKNPIDEFEAAITEEQQLAELKEDLTIGSYSYTNQRTIAVGTTPVLIAQINVIANKATSANFHAQLLPSCEEDCRLIIEYKLNDTLTSPVVIADIAGGKRLPICLFNYFPVIVQGFSSVRLYARTESGTAVFPNRAVTATVSGQHFASVVINRSPNRTIWEQVDVQTMERYIGSAFGETLRTSTQITGRNELRMTLPVCEVRLPRTVGDIKENVSASAH